LGAKAEIPAALSRVCGARAFAKDNLKTAKAQMQQWIANGVKLGWLIDGDAETVYVFCPGQPVMEKRADKGWLGKSP
jgi:Uma2 family endonuclease